MDSLHKIKDYLKLLSDLLTDYQDNTTWNKTGKRVFKGGKKADYVDFFECIEATIEDHALHISDFVEVVQRDLKDG